MMGVVGSKRWTPEEDALLRSLYASFDAKEVGHRLGRTPTSITARAHKIGATRRVWNSNLPPTLQQEVVSLYGKGLTVAEVQAATGLTYHQAKWCLSEASITPDRVRAGKAATLNSVRDLTSEEQAQVRVLWESGVSVANIAAKIGCWKKVVRRFAQSNLPPRSVSAVMALNSGVRKRFTPADQAEIIRLCTDEMQTIHEVASTFGCARRTMGSWVRRLGVDVPAWHRKKLSLRALASYRSGRRVVSPHAGHGIKTPHATPFQGVRILRSSTEGARARSLDAAGVAWFYEVQRFPLAAGDTYLPDFWITEVPLAVARQVLGSAPSAEAILTFLRDTPHAVEDVKGWYGPQHPSKEKIDRFTVEYADLSFRINVIKTGEV